MSLRALPVCLVFGASLASPAAQGPSLRFEGAADGEALGTGAVWARDVDGDRVPDLVAGAPGAAGGAGEVRVWSGADGALLHVFTGASAGDGLGHAVASADVDGDGRSDVIAGAPGDDGAGADAGSVSVWSGRSGALLQRVDGLAAGDRLGAAVAAGGDVDGDGYDDFAGGAPGDARNGVGAGSARAWSGATGRLLADVPGDGAGDGLGAAVALAGDLDGDCRGEILAGAPGDDDGGQDAGAVRVVSGAGGNLFTVFGAAAGDGLGTAVAALGDVDGDGIDDLVAGAPGDDGAGGEAGAVQVLSGADGSPLARFAGGMPGDGLGTAVAGLPDADGDELPDVVAGAPNASRDGLSGNGLVQVLSGASRRVLYERHGDAAGDAMGAAVAGGFDLDADGYSDWLAAAPGDDSGGSNAGAVEAHARRPFSDAEIAVTHRQAPANSWLGYWTSSLGDVDGDGVPDYGASALFDAGRLGTVRVYSGADHSVLRTYTGTVPDGWYGDRFAGVGDIDGDGVPDIGIGAWHISGPNPGEFQSGKIYVHSGVDGSLIHELTGSSFHGHLGSAVGGMGDVDGDGVGDFMGSAGLWQNERGIVRVYSGATGMRLFGIPGSLEREWFGWNARAMDDVDGDGIRDIVAGAAQHRLLPTPGVGAARILSGADGSQLLEVNGDQAQSLFGWSVDGLGDLSGDGVPDIVVGAYRQANGAIVDAGVVRAFSGADGTMLWEVPGSAAGDLMGWHVAGAGDVDGDGVDDVLASAPQEASGSCVGPGYVSVLSGRDGRVLYTVVGENDCDSTGESAAGIGDIDGDGLSDFVVGADLEDGNGTNAGMARVFITTRLGPTGRVVSFGSGCPTGASTLPRIAVTERPTVGRSSTVTLRAAPPQASAWLMLDAAASGVDLGTIGMPGCVAWALPTLVVPAATDPLGKASLALAVPPMPSLVGSTLFTQWLARDLAANPRGLVVSDAAAITFGD